MYVDNSDPRHPLIMFRNEHEVAEWAVKVLSLIRSPNMVAGEGMGIMLKAPAADGTSKPEDWAPGSLKMAMMPKD